MNWIYQLGISNGIRPGEKWDSIRKTADNFYEKYVDVFPPDSDEKLLPQDAVPFPVNCWLYRGIPNNKLIHLLSYF